MSPIGTWKSAILRLGYRTSALLNSLGIGNFALARGLKRTVRQVLTRDNRLLINTRGLRMYIYSDTATTEEYLARPFEPGTTALLERHIRPGTVFLDIGAQFGFFSLLGARAAGSSGRIYAFEPVPKNFALLERNVQINRLTNIVAVQRAVGDRPGSVEMFVYGDSDSHSMYRHPQAVVAERISVPLVTVDDFLQGQPVDVIKMDVEGNEPRVLEGMTKTIARSENLVVVAELAPAYLRRAGVEPSDYLARLAALGFSAQLIDETTGELRSVPGALSDDPSWKANLLCRKRGE